MQTFKATYLGLLLATFNLSAEAVRLPLQASSWTTFPNTLSSPTSFRSSPLRLKNSYPVDITVGGATHSVIADTGSTDMRISGNVHRDLDTGTTSTVHFASGLGGAIEAAPLRFTGYDTPDQAFTLLRDSSAATNDHPTGTSGVLGSGPGGRWGITRSLGHFGDDSMMTRIFEQLKTSSSHSYITLLSGKDKRSEESGGQMTISEVVPGYESILDQTPLSVIYPDQWATWTDVNGIIGPDGSSVNIQSSVSDAESGRLVAVVDRSSALTHVPPAIAEAIYGQIPGAVYVSTISGGLWVVLCHYETNVTLVFGGQKIFIHPLDMLNPALVEGAEAAGICTGSFQPFQTPPVGYDIILGSNFLRNAYTLLDYGDTTSGVTPDTDRFIQFLSITDPAKAHEEFIASQKRGLSTASLVVSVLALLSVLAYCGVCIAGHRRRLLKSSHEGYRPIDSGEDGQGRVLRGDSTVAQMALMQLVRDREWARFEEWRRRVSVEYSPANTVVGDDLDS